MEVVQPNRPAIRQAVGKYYDAANGVPVARCRRVRHLNGGLDGVVEGCLAPGAHLLGGLRYLEAASRPGAQPGPAC